MTKQLAEAIETYLRSHGKTDGTIPTPVPGLTLIRATAPSQIDYDISKPLVALVAEGRKEVALGSKRVAMARGELLLITADIPTASRITEASTLKPYRSLVFELDAGIIAELRELMPEKPAEAGPVLVSLDAGEAMTDAARRMVRLLDCPEDRRVLAPQIMREMHYRLLQGPYGATIRRLGMANGHEARIARAVEHLRRDFSKPLRIGDLAEDAGMSLSAFHQHFRAITTLTPLQFQKQLRLIDARRKMLSEGLTAASAAYAVGYESVPQFTREYGRFFGAPPARDVEELRLAIA